ncbi:FAD binding domain-containing protein [Pararhizobium haloflavum]|uniref:FAD binding domain-containing protein n=1 Tax=Pararhizobium haloflavum TaxID=2037914 RepID=UPI000C17D2B3|nr:xanthine dehydrogenase family protein subunit M [Pararhizobium haloflavum]
MYATTYHKAKTVDEAVKLVGQSESGKFLSGGMSLLPTMKQRLAAPSDLVDLRHIPEMKGISVSGSEVKIGGAATHYEIKESAELAKACYGLHSMASVLGDPQVRYMGTIGGSLANNDPAADYPAAMLALDATIHTNARTLKASEFFAGLLETALEDDEIVTAVSFTAPEKSGYEKFRNPASRYAMCGVFVAKTGSEVRVGVTGAGADGVFSWDEAASALSSNFSADAIKDLAVDPGELLSDLHGSSEYRANLVKVMAKRAVESAR